MSFRLSGFLLDLHQWKLALHMRGMHENKFVLDRPIWRLLGCILLPGLMVSPNNY